MFPSPLSTPLLLVCLTCTLSWSAISQADGYLGAEAILQQAAQPKDGVALSADALAAKIAAFKPDKLPPETAAKEWLGLLKSRWAIDPAERYSGEIGLDKILAVLPPPPAWEALKAEVEKRPPDHKNRDREFSLQTIIHLLTDNPKAALEEFDQYRAKLKETDPSRLIGNSSFDYIEEIIIRSIGDPKLVAARLEQKLSSENDAGLSHTTVTVPDLVSLVGHEKASALLIKLFTQSDQTLAIPKDKETRELARALALKNVDALKQPQWALAETLDGSALFEALEKRFPKSNDRDYARRSAENDYFIYLIASGKKDQAEQRILALPVPDDHELPFSGIKTLRRLGKTRDLFEFMDVMLSKNPNLSYWNQYITLAIDLKETDRAVKRLDTARKSDRLIAKTKRAIDEKRPEILLALNQVDEGIAGLQKLLEEPIAKTEDQEEIFQSRADAAVKLTRLGILLERKPLVETGLKELQTTVDSAQALGITLSRAKSDLPDLFFKTGQGKEAEKILGRLLESNEDAQSVLIDLCALYSQAGRHADVIVLLEQAKGWKAGDLAPFLTESTGIFVKERSTLPIGYIAAKALFATGREDEAKTILKYLLQELPGFDPAYELLLTIKGPAAVEDFDLIIAQDKFQERPLIWKAELLLKSGKLEDAEAVIRQAIAIDPSDGEESPDDRMRAYAVLAKIREAHGDEKEAALYQNVIKAIRLSEDADRYASAGLLTRATEMYQEALTYFADAYCVQSRLAKNLWELGRHEEAEVHYRRAYELMPDSFGRVESHCFGCEGAFEGEKQQAIAEQIFTGLAKKKPDNPQVHYLLGYLLEEQEKEAEALECYRTAVKLDPDYLNAWKKIVDIGMDLPVNVREEAILQTLRLDPLGRHGSRSNLQHIRSRKKIWEAAALAAKSEVPVPKTLYPLKASHESIQQNKQQNRMNYFGMDRAFSPADEVVRSFSMIVWGLNQ